MSRELMDQGRGHQLAKQRVGLMRTRLQLGMELHGDKERVVGEFHDLDQLAIGRQTGEHDSRLLELPAVGVVHLVPMTVTFTDLGRAVNFRCK